MICKINIPFSIYSLPFFCLLLFSFNSCSSAEKPLPEWIIHQPVEEAYWYGLGVSSDRELARDHAFNEIAAQIEVHIKSDLARIVTEYDYDIHEYTRSLVETRMDITLSEAELVNTFERDGEFYVLARLDRQEYYSRVAIMRDRAVKQSLDYIQLSREQFGLTTFSYLAEAQKSITGFLDESLPVPFPEFPDSVISLPSLILQNLTAAAARVELIHNPPELQAIHFLPEDQKIAVLCVDRLTGMNLAQIPLRINMGQNEGTVRVVTDQSGSALVVLRRVVQSQSPQQIEITLDVDQWWPPREMVVIHPPVPSITVNIHVDQLQIEIEVSETILGQELSPRMVLPFIQTEMKSNLDVVFTNENNSNAILRLKVEAQPLSDSPREYFGKTIYTCMATLELELTSNDRQLFNGSLTQIKGVSFRDHKEAGEAAISKLVEQVKQSLLPDLYSALGL